MEDMPEALFMVLASLARCLVDNGALKTKQLETMAKAFDLQAQATLIESKKANCSLAADLSRIMLMASADPTAEIKHPHLRLVPPDGTEGDAPA